MSEMHDETDPKDGHVDIWARRRDELVRIACDRYRAKFPDSTKTDDEIRAEMERIIDGYLSSRE